MDITLQPVLNRRDLRAFVTFPWRIYRTDRFWVPPLIASQIARLDPRGNPFWRNGERGLWIARAGSQPLGTIAAVIDHNRNRSLKRAEGTFGFFECVDDPRVSQVLFRAAEDWLRQRGMIRVEGPYNPSPTDECGVLVEGFGTRPALLEAHNPPYYAALVEDAGYQPFTDLVARLYHRPPDIDFRGAMPEKLVRIAEKVQQRADLRVRPLDVRRWEAEIEIGCRIYNQALETLGDHVPILLAEFASFAESFRPFIDPQMALIAEIGGQPVGFALALPDMYEALQHANGHSGPIGLAQLWWHSRHLKRVSFKILMVLPEYQSRGVDALLVYETARRIWARGFTEIDMSLTGNNNPKSNRYQANMGFQIYRRYRIYQKGL